MNKPFRVLAFVAPPALALLFGRIHAEYIGDYQFVSDGRFVADLAFGLLLSASFLLFVTHISLRVVDRVIACIQAAVLAVIVLAAVQTAVGSPLVPRFVVLWTTAFFIPVEFLIQRLALDVSSFRAAQQRCLLWGPSSTISDLEQQIERFGVPVRLVKTGDPASGSFPEFAQTGETYDMIVIADAELNEKDNYESLARLHAAGVRVRTISQFYEQYLGRIAVPFLLQTWLLLDVSELHSTAYRAGKRAIDLFTAVIMGAVCLLVIPLVVLGNWLGNRGPLFYSQQRVGRNGQLFTIHKFRTMKAGESSSWTEKSDQRVTPFGKLLRRSHLDELPQAWNILRGDLSLIGPRPEQPSYIKELSEQIPFYDFRQIVRPGVTGWAQVLFSYGSSAEDALQKLQYDFYYIKHQSLWLDLRIMLLTLRASLLNPGR